MGPKQCAPSVSEGASFADLSIFWSEFSSGCCFTNVMSRPCGIKRQAGERQKCRARARWGGAWRLCCREASLKAKREGWAEGPSKQEKRIMTGGPYFTFAKRSRGWCPM